LQNKVLQAAYLTETQNLSSLNCFSQEVHGMNKLYLIGAAFGAGGCNKGSEDAAQAFQNSREHNELTTKGINIHWHKTITEKPLDNKLEIITGANLALAKTTQQLVKENKRFCVIGGDHSCAIGTWSGAVSALPDTSELGLIWIDAHMDAHTPETSLTGNIHGMPVASLLGYGHKQLTDLLSKQIKIKPQNICLIGIRSYEADEEKLLNDLGVKIFFNTDVEALGVEEVMRQAIAHISQSATHLGISIDLDGLDPSDAPGVGTPVDKGINGQEFCASLAILNQHKNFIGYEVVEYNPHLDIEDKTASIMNDIIIALESTTTNQTITTD
jgi:arginase